MHYRMGKIFAEKLKVILEYPWVGDVCSIGLLGGIEFEADQKTKQSFNTELKFDPKFVQTLGKHGVLGRVSKGDILAMAPPFMITEAEMDTLLNGILV